ncbi:MAG TPA: HD-GYP domain-containing protein, partial [Candidatus Limnocylindrales bacterium]
LLMISGPTRADGVVAALLAAAVAVTAGVAINTLLVVLGASVLYGQSIAKTLSEGVAATVPSQLTLGVVGVLMAQVAAAIGAPGLALFVVPLLVARQTYERTVQLRGAYADTIASLVAALEAKDVYTKGHSVRVARYACATARHLGMPDAKVDRLEWAALLHDIGKVGVSRRVLSKNGKLSESEYDEIKRHPAIGARILEDVPYLADLVPSIEAHHERLDGSGYGSGACGSDIPMEARVLAVADAYDAMTSTRPYRTAMPHIAAVDQLQRGRGTQFDGEVVDAFLAAFEDSSLSDGGAPA